MEAARRMPSLRKESPTCFHGGPDRNYCNCSWPTGKPPGIRDIPFHVRLVLPVRAPRCTRRLALRGNYITMHRTPSLHRATSAAVCWMLACHPCFCDVAAVSPDLPDPRNPCLWEPSDEMPWRRYRCCSKNEPRRKDALGDLLESRHRDRLNCHRLRRCTNLAAQTWDAKYVSSIFPGEHAMRRCIPAVRVWLRRLAKWNISRTSRAVAK